MENKLVKALLWILLICFYVIVTVYVGYFISHMHIKNTLLENVTYIFGELLITVCLVFLYRKDFKGKFQELKNPDGNKKIIYSLKTWGFGLLTMVIFNIILGIFIKDIAVNESANREVLLTHSLYAITTMTILTPICEEIIFRLSPSKMIDNKYVYVLFTSVMFGFAHVLSATGPQALYIIPYASLGAAFGLIYNKNQNILCSILMHSIHNLACVMIVLFL